MYTHTCIRMHARTQEKLYTFQCTLIINLQWRSTSKFYIFHEISVNIHFICILYTLSWHMYMYCVHALINKKKHTSKILSYALEIVIAGTWQRYRHHQNTSHYENKICKETTTITKQINITKKRIMWAENEICTTKRWRNGKRNKT